MANLVSMKLSKADLKEREDAIMSAPKLDGDQYPWGLSLHLDNDSMEKLKLKGLPAGQEMMLVAKVKVTNSSVSSEGDGKETASASLQIMEMALDLPPARTSLADGLYGKDE